MQERSATKSGTSGRVWRWRAARSILGPMNAPMRTRLALLCLLGFGTAAGVVACDDDDEGGETPGETPSGEGSCG